jgi:hypothetical protein
MNDTMTSWNIDLYSWDILYISAGIMALPVYETYLVLHMPFYSFMFLPPYVPTYFSYTEMASVGTLLNSFAHGRPTVQFRGRQSLIPFPIILFSHFRQPSHYDRSLPHIERISLEAKLYRLVLGRCCLRVSAQTPALLSCSCLYSVHGGKF